MEKPQKAINEVRDWAQYVIDGGQEPPWAWYEYMKLLDAIQALSPKQDIHLVGDEKIEVNLPF